MVLSCSYSCGESVRVEVVLGCLQDELPIEFRVFNGSVNILKHQTISNYDE